ncbi:hypothetical protein N4T77_18940 [Clostridium sp. CX1]|uniref:hypothetical protein n=1 Tax=Clostridium sp. CX1 TaxID=2978346 RepID=UPI0021BED9CD|nr:hypothetical protein [Clostridium sp. CX1]MCT8978670.1 hypothetical protein [Clostridium sp. CX1]
MKNEEQIKKGLANKLRQQADRLEKGDTESIRVYKIVRNQVEVLEDVLELNILCQCQQTEESEEVSTDLYKNRRD